MIWLTANPRAHVYSFDLNRWPITDVMVNYIKERFPERFNITFGDSTKTLPEFHRQNLDVKCDLVVIDGTWPQARRMKSKYFPADGAAKTYNIFVYDIPD